MHPFSHPSIHPCTHSSKHLCVQACIHPSFTHPSIHNSSIHPCTHPSPPYTHPNSCDSHIRPSIHLPIHLFKTCSPIPFSTNLSPSSACGLGQSPHLRFPPPFWVSFPRDYMWKHTQRPWDVNATDGGSAACYKVTVAHLLTNAEEWSHRWRLQGGTFSQPSGWPGNPDSLQPCFLFAPI